MLTFVTLTRYSNAPAAPAGQLAEGALQEIRKKHPEVECLHNGETQCEGSYSHIFITPDIETAEEVADIVCHFGDAIPEVWTATDFMTYKRMLKQMPIPK